LYGTSISLYSCIDEYSWQRLFRAVLPARDRSVYVSQQTLCYQNRGIQGLLLASVNLSSVIGYDNWHVLFQALSTARGSFIPLWLQAFGTRCGGILYVSHG
jgi:hypothetical protein